MIKRTVGFLGLLASIMALSSLIYGAFHEPLYPYMQGLVGGILDAYRTMRDIIFTGLGWAFSGLINWVAQFLNWLPPAPWLTVTGILKDAITLYFILQSAMSALLFGILSSGGQGAPLVFRYEDRIYVNWAFIFSLAGLLFWPAYFLIYFFLPAKNMRDLRILRDKIIHDNGSGFMTPDMPWTVGAWGVLESLIRWRNRIISIGGGTLGFFLLVYAENQIGL